MKRYQLELTEQEYAMLQAMANFGSFRPAWEAFAVCQGAPEVGFNRNIRDSLCQKLRNLQELEKDGYDDQST